MNYFTKLIDLNYYINDLVFHPNNNLLLSSSIHGGLTIFKISKESPFIIKEWENNNVHLMSVRCARFSSSGNDIISVSSDKTVSLIDIDKNKCKWRGKGHKDGINSLCLFDDNLIATGDDNGEIRIWDLRLNKSTCKYKIKEYDEIINGLIIGNTINELLAISGDQIGVFDMKNNKLIAMSDNIEDELLCISIIKNGKKVLCGSQMGTIYFFTYGYWGDVNDLISVNKDTVNSIIKLNENIICTSGDDGQIHIINIHPNEIKGQLINYKSLSNNIKTTYSLTVNFNNNLLAFVGDFQNIYITDIQEALDIHNNVNNNDFFNEI